MADWMVEEQARIDADYEDWLMSRPTCHLCEDPITDEYAYEIGGMMICAGCMANLKVDLEG